MTALMTGSKLLSRFDKDAFSPQLVLISSQKESRAIYCQQWGSDLRQMASLLMLKKEMVALLSVWIQPGPDVQSIVSLTMSLRGQLVK